MIPHLEGSMKYAIMCQNLSLNVPIVKVIENKQYTTAGLQKAIYSSSQPFLDRGPPAEPLTLRVAPLSFDKIRG